MKKVKTLLIAVILLVGVTQLLAKSQILSFSYANTSIETIEALANEEGCPTKHKNDCHSGGPYSSECTIGASFHVCIGGVGGNCSIACREGAYACCGLDCKCIRDGE